MSASGRSPVLIDLFASERRVDDRRRFTWRTVALGFARPRRRMTRRAADFGVDFVDWHHPWLFFLAVGTMLLSCADAFLTLILISGGMIEANPVMAAAMNVSTGWFVASKMALTGTGILMLVALSRTRFLNLIRTGLILTCFFSFYCCLICYEVVSLLNML